MKHEGFSKIEHPNSPVNFIITDCPSNENTNFYIPVLVENQVHYLFRLCTATYETRIFHESEIEIIDDISFDDGNNFTD